MWLLVNTHSIYLTAWLANFAVSISLICSMYLMMDHNKGHYLQLLKRLKCMKLHWICCKWRYIVIEQLNELENIDNLEEIVDQSRMTHTMKPSMDIPRINTNPSEISIE